jgi:hypothetical protein
LWQDVWLGDSCIFLIHYCDFFRFQETTLLHCQIVYFYFGALKYFFGYKKYISIINFRRKTGVQRTCFGRVWRVYSTLACFGRVWLVYSTMTMLAFPALNIYDVEIVLGD